MPDDPIELDEPATAFVPVHDKRPAIPQPPPVHLVAIDDVHLPAPIGLRDHLDRCYLTALGFLAEPARDNAAAIVYRADNFRLCFDLKQPPLQRDGVRVTVIQVVSLPDVRQRLIDQKIEHETVRGLDPGSELVILRDPAGNWLALAECRVAV
jgi:hypothetical protein